MEKRWFWFAWCENGKFQPQATWRLSYRSHIEMKWFVRDKFAGAGASKTILVTLSNVWSSLLDDKCTGEKSPESVLACIPALH